MNKSSPQGAVFYTVPKIHKNLNRPPGRPIVSTRGTVLEPLSTYIDSYLRPLLSRTPSFLRDTTDFLRVLKSCSAMASEEAILLVTLDVRSLYTSIPQSAAFDTVKVSLQSREDLTTAHLAFILQLTDHDFPKFLVS